MSFFILIQQFINQKNIYYASYNTFLFRKSSYYV
jgi:hypothetical protein